MSNPKSILVIDDEDSICFAFQRFFEARGWQVHVAASAKEGLLSYRENQPSVIFLDVRLPDRSGMDLLADFDKDASTSVIVITAYSSLETTVRAVQGKAFDYLVKPLDLDKASMLAQRALERHRVIGRSGASSMTSIEQPPLLIGNSPAMQEVYRVVARAANSSTGVLISGATGTGKELVARAIHDFSPRCQGPFVAVNCGALPETLVESELFGAVRGAFTGADYDRAGRFELANGGTLFLDEVGELTASAQVKLLRVLDSRMVERVGSVKPRQVDVRILAATNRDLQQEVQAGRFRADLYYRLAVFDIHLPLLREHKGDILQLAAHFLGRSGEPGLSAASVDLLMKHDWPGNVRELKNAMEHALAVAPDRTILPEDLPVSLRQSDVLMEGDDNRLRQSILACMSNLCDSDSGRYGHIIEHVERVVIEYALKRFNGHQSEAAAYLGLHRNTLRNKLRELDLIGPGQSSEPAPE